MKQAVLIFSIVLFCFSLNGAEKKNFFSQVAMVMVKKTVTYDKNDISSVLKKDWPGLSAVKDFSGSRGTSVFTLGPCKIVIAAMLTPIPSKELKYPLNTALFWDNAAEEIKSHTTHYVVYVSSPTASRIDVNTVCVKVVKSLSSLTSAIGVYWGSSSQVINRKTFSAYASMIKNNAMPVPIWVKVTGYRKKNGNYYVYTVGLHAFGHRELEIQNYKGSFKDVYFFMLDLSDYVLKSKNEIKDGDSIGSAKKDRMRVRFKKSDINKNVDVMSIEFN